LYAVENVDYRSYTSSSQVGSSSGGGTLIGTWDAKEKKKVMNQVNKILGLVKVLAGRSDDSVKETITNLRKIQEARFNDLTRHIDETKQNITKRLPDTSNIVLIQEDIQVIGSAIEALMEFIETKQIVEEVEDVVTN
jgi:hypothetical protein